MMAGTQHPAKETSPPPYVYSQRGGLRCPKRVDCFTSVVNIVYSLGRWRHTVWSTCLTSRQSPTFILVSSSHSFLIVGILIRAYYVKAVSGFIDNISYLTLSSAVTLV